MTNSGQFTSTVLNPGQGRRDQSQVTGVLLVGHGTRDSSGLTEFWETVNHIIPLLPGVHVEGSFLEIASPDIAEGIHRLVCRGCEHVIVAPMLLFAAGHAKRDIPTSVQNSAVRYPHLTVSYSQTLDDHPILLDLSEQRFRESVGNCEPTDGSGASWRQMSLVMVGRGSRDHEATQLMHDYASKLAGRLQIAHFSVGFLAMAEPHVDVAIEKVIQIRPERIVVQPHLLFRGELLSELEARIQQYQRRYSDIDWRVAQHLGASSRVAEAVVARLTKISWSTT